MPRLVLQHSYSKPALLWLIAAIALTLALESWSLAQQPAPRANPEDFGLTLPQMPATIVRDRRVLAPDGTGNVVVANVLFEAGDRTVAILPSGRLTSLAATEATVTERPFVATKADELARQLVADQFNGFKTRTTRRYAYVYNASEPFFKATSRILETMYPALLAWCKRHKLAVHDPAVPLVVILFRTQQEFDAYHAMPEGVVAYYNVVTNHVLMYEQSQLLEIAPDLAVKQSISTIAHEGVHQVLHNIGVQQRLSEWPMWISEGLPEYFAPTTVDKRIRWKGVGLTNDLRMKLLEPYFGPGGGVGAGEIVAPTVEAESLTSTGYAAAWALTHFLAERRREAFFAYLAEVSASPPLAKRSIEEERGLFTRHFGADLARMESDIAAHLKKLPYTDPVANQTHYVAMIEFGDRNETRRSVAVTTSPSTVRTWQQDQMARVPADQQAGAQFAVQAFPTKGAATEFAEAWLKR